MTSWFCFEFDERDDVARGFQGYYNHDVQSIMHCMKCQHLKLYWYKNLKDSYLNTLVCKIPGWDSLISIKYP